ncbi:phage tail protein [Halomonas sp. BM-2019]|uniref:phage tail protein n=1 Tax=Halomonas sp. BM-2019 TaxID=2811227 RepID=UPI001B3C4033|nr:MAG: hypothetical protein J5F18_09775 [Halomonas sp. BM-2019]
MDVNGSNYFLLREPEDFSNATFRMTWNPSRDALTLAPNQALRLPSPTPAAALAAWTAATPLALDAFGQLARLSADRSGVEYNAGHAFRQLRDGEFDPVIAPTGTLRDLALGGDGRLAMPWSDDANAHGLLVFHLVRRWQSMCELPEAPLRAWVGDDDTLWCVSAGSLMCCRGQPLPLPYQAQPERFEPLQPNPDPLAMRWQQALPPGLSALAICGDGAQLYVLCHAGSGAQTVLVRPAQLRSDLPFAHYIVDADAPFAIDLAALAPRRLAALAPRDPGDADFAQRDCAVLEPVERPGEDSGLARLVRERHPMLSLAVPRFVTSADRRVRYQAEADDELPTVEPRPRLLQPLRRPAFHTAATGLMLRPLDSGRPDTIWHRIYVDGCIPAGCHLQIAVRAYDDPARRTRTPLILQPRPVWNPLPSELPFAAGIAAHKPGESGLFEILLQRNDGPVRRIAGRYLQLQLRLAGNRRETPAIHALRVYAPRFSYQEAYLPELFRQEFDVAPDATGPANGADVRERLLAAFEGVLTPIEGRVAAADQLLHPNAAPPDNLAWLGATLGERIPGYWPLPRQRRQLRNIGLLQQWKGTLGGVNLALDIATDGGIQRGEVVVLENFRLRRTLATVLGVSMDDRDHPLTLGTGMSGNSIVGESLILSEADAREFLALFSPELAAGEEVEIVERFFERYAHQVSVLLHGRGTAQREAVETVLRQHMPAHLQWRLFETEHPFVLGTAPLLAMDTYVEHAPAARRVVIDDTRLGREGVLTNPAAFSPRDLNAAHGAG